MKEEDGVKLSQTLYARAEKIWPRYLCHPFVTQMADGTLPPEKFRYYMLQDYLYLKDYVKIFAAIIQKADDFEQIRFLSGELADTIGETFRTHIPYMKRLGITEEEIHSTRPHMDNNAYTHYMLWEAQTGDVLTGLVTLLNCSWSYAYVAEKIVERAVARIFGLQGVVLLPAARGVLVEIGVGGYRQIEVRHVEGRGLGGILTGCHASHCCCEKNDFFHVVRDLIKRGLP